MAATNTGVYLFPKGCSTPDKYFLPEEAPDPFLIQADSQPLHLNSF